MDIMTVKPFFDGLLPYKKVVLTTYLPLDDVVEIFRNSIEPYTTRSIFSGPSTLYEGNIWGNYFTMKRIVKTRKITPEITGTVDINKDKTIITVELSNTITYPALLFAGLMSIMFDVMFHNILPTVVVCGFIYFGSLVSFRSEAPQAIQYLKLLFQADEQIS